MRRSFLLILTMSAFAFSYCGDDPAEPGDGDGSGSQYDGSFSVSNLLVTNDCAAPAPPPVVMNVTVEDDTIYFGGIKGLWDEGTLTGTSIPDEVTVPVLPPDCYSYYTAVYFITFSSPDSFSGIYGADYRHDAACPDPDPCSFRYEITGSR